MLTMGQFSKILLSSDNAHTVPHRALHCRPGLGGLNQVYGPHHHTASVYSICAKYINIFTTFTNRIQCDILMTAVTDVSKGQTDMSYKGELIGLTLLKLTCKFFHNINK